MWTNFPPPPKKRAFEGNIAENEVSSILMKLLGKHTHTEHLQFVCVIFDSKYICDILVFFLYEVAFSDKYKDF